MIRNSFPPPLCDFLDDALRCMPHLKHLVLDGNKTITGDVLEFLPQLEALSLAGNRNVQNSHLRKLTRVKYLNLDGVHNCITGEGIAHLPLEALSLAHNVRIRDADLVKMTGLQRLSVRGNSYVTTAVIAGLPQLKTLYVYQTDSIWRDDPVEYKIVMADPDQGDEVDFHGHLHFARFANSGTRPMRYTIHTNDDRRIDIRWDTQLKFYV